MLTQKKSQPVNAESSCKYKQLTFRQLINKRGQKRLRSSETEGEIEISTDSDTASDIMDTSVGASEFMTHINNNWDAILLRLQNSLAWREKEDWANSMDTEIQDLRRENELLRKRLLVTEGRLTRTEKKLDEANNKIIDLTSRSMRDNLIFKNIEEHEGEDLEGILRNILKEKLKIRDTDMEVINFERIHRMGGKPSGGRSRNIIAKISSKGKQVIMAHLRNLPSNDSLKVQEQFPPEVNARRNKLWPMYIEARQSGKTAKFNVDKLVVDKKVIKAEPDRVKDINMDVTSRSLEMQVKHTTVTTNEGSHFQGHAVEVTSTDDVIPAIQALCKDHGVAGSSHVMYAYRIGNENRYVSNYEDDGEWGGGREIMRTLDSEQCFNKLIAVTRWQGGRNLGPNRFQYIRDTAKQAIELAPPRQTVA